MNLRVPRITHTELSYDKALLPEARVTGLILNDIPVRKTQDAGYKQTATAKAAIIIRWARATGIIIPGIGDS